MRLAYTVALVLQWFPKWYPEDAGNGPTYSGALDDRAWLLHSRKPHTGKGMITTSI